MKAASAADVSAVQFFATHFFFTDWARPQIKNVGAYFVLYLDGRNPTVHATYTKALRTLKRDPKAQGIVPKADAVHYIAEVL